MSSEFNLTPLQVEELEKELEENPFNIRALSELAQYFASQSDYAQACKHYEKIVRVNEENGKAWTALGHCYLLKGEYQKCFTAYQKALYTMEDNRDPQLWYGIGLLYHKFESYEFAEPAYQAVLRIDPNFEQKHEVLYKLGLIYKKTNAYENAVIYLKNSIACENIPISRKVDALCHIGNSYEREEKLDEALKIYEEALAMDPQNFKTMEYLGWALVHKGKFSEAIDNFNKAIDLAKENCAEVGDLYYLLGRTYLEMKNFIEGQAAFQKAIYKNPNAYIYWSSIGILYAKAMQPQDAFECFVKASNISQDAGDIWFNMAVLYEHCNQRQEASLAYQRAFSLDNQNALAAERKSKLQNNEDLEQIPAFAHPVFELSEVPFSIKKNDKGMKPMKNLPDINKLKREGPSNDSILNASDDDAEKSDSGSDKSSDYSPTAPEIKPKVQVHVETKPNTGSFASLPFSEMPKAKMQPSPAPAPVKLQPSAMSMPSVKIEKDPPPPPPVQREVVSNPHPVSNPQPLGHGNLASPNKVSFQSENSNPAPPVAAFNNATTNNVSQNPQPNPNMMNMNNMHPMNNNMPGMPYMGMQSMGINQSPNMMSGMPANMPSMSNMPNNIQNLPNMPTMPHMPMSQMSGMPSNMPNMPTAMANMPPNMQGMSPNMQGMPPNMQGMPPNMQNMLGMPSNMSGMQGMGNMAGMQGMNGMQGMQAGMPNMANMSPMPGMQGMQGMQGMGGMQGMMGMPGMMPMNMPNMAMMMGMMPGMQQNPNNANKSPANAQMNPFQLAQLQAMMMNPMSGMMPGLMMNPMAGFMQGMRMMHSRQPPQPTKKETEEDLAEALTKLTEDDDEGDDDDEDFRKKRRGDKSKDTLIKKRKR